MLSTFVDDSIALHYQPIADLNGRVLGFEALLRWHHHRHGLISPEAFIPIFENCGLFLPLSGWALRQACQDAVAWKRPLQVSVNLSPLQFGNDDLPDLVKLVLAETGLVPERLELEVTEAALAKDAVKALSILQRLAAQGVHIVLDNAGEGVELPFLLRDYPFSRIKIARSVVRHIEGSVSARSIVHMIILAGHAMHVLVTAKGVESTRQLAYLAAEGCDFIQGFLIGRPAAITAFATLTRNDPADPMASVAPLQHEIDRFFIAQDNALKERRQ